jgi:outer membrane protein assembly factor BamE (lipoprotein component of BamABCDE complex)
MQAEGRDLTRRRSIRVASSALRQPAAAALLLGVVLAGCSGPGAFTQSYHRGYIVPEGALEQIPLGASQDQVLIVLGTPSTVATVNGEAFYYISQKAQRSAAFMPHEVVDQRVIAVYFDKERRVTRLANYGLKDGKIFDFQSQTTPTGGQELSYLRNIFKNVGFHFWWCPPMSQQKRARASGPFVVSIHRSQCASTASSSSATMLVILIIGFTAGPAVSL